MIILTKQLLNNNENFIDMIEKEKKLINSTIQLQKNLLDHLSQSHNYLNLLEINIELLTILLELFDNLNVDMDSETIAKFNTIFFETNETVLENTLQVLHPSQKEETKESIENSIDLSTLTENTLIVSEIKGKVFLPYTLDDINNILKNNQDKYSNIEEIINEEYTLPFDLFKNPAVARFRETFKLVRKKEKNSVKQAFDLGLELIFNYNLHPAIISACKNLDELDIYLDYLENNEIEKFDCFKIIFEIPPKLAKSSDSF